MTDREIQRKLNRLAKIANELDAEARRRYPESGSGLWYADGYFCILSGDVFEGPRNSQNYVKFSSNTLCRMDSGSW